MSEPSVIASPVVMSPIVVLTSILIDKKGNKKADETGGWGGGADAVT